MVRKKRSSTQRKQKLQLEDDKKHDSSRAASNFDYAQMTSSSAGINKTEGQGTSDEGSKSTDHKEKAGEGNGGAMDSKLAGFLKEIEELGSSEQGETQVDNGHKQMAAEMNSGDGTSHNKVSSRDMGQESVSGDLQQQPATSHAQAAPEVTFWQEVMDPNTNHVYYWNAETNEVSWTLPPNGVIANETAASGGDSDSGMGTGKPTTSGTESGSSSQSGVGMEASNTAKGRAVSSALNDSAKSTTSSSSGGSNSSVVKSSSQINKAKRKTEVDMFVTESESDSAAVSTAPISVDQNQEVDVKAATFSSTSAGAVKTTEKSSSKKRKSSPQSSDFTAVKEDEEEQRVGDKMEGFPRVKKQRLTVHGGDGGESVVGAGGQASGGERGRDGVGGGSSSNAAASKQAEQVLRFQVSNFADELSRKLQYLHVSCDALSDLQVLQVQLQTRLSDWKEGGLSSKFMLNKLKQFNTDLERYERSSAPEGWKFVWDSSSCRYKFYNLSTGESSWSYPMLGENTSAPLVRAMKEDEDEMEFNNQDNVMETEKPVKQEQQPVRPVLPPDDQPKIPEPCPQAPQPTPPSQPSQSSQQKPKQVKPVHPAQPTSKVVTPTQGTTATTTAAVANKSKSQKQVYQVPTAEYLRAPEGPVVLPVSRFQKRMEEKQAELDNPVESWNLSVKDVRKILSGKHRPTKSSASNDDDVIGEGDYPMDSDEGSNEEEVGGAKHMAIVMPGDEHEKAHQEYIAEFPPRHERSPPTSQSRLSGTKKAERSSASPISSTNPASASATAKLQHPTVPVDPRKRGKSSAGNRQKQTPPPNTTPITQPTPLPPPHLKSPVTMVISRDPRVAKRQQQQLTEKLQPSSSLSQQHGQDGPSSETNGEGTEVSPTDNSHATLPESSPQKPLEVDEARLRERLLLRQKYRIRKASDHRDSREDSSEERQTSPITTTTIPHGHPHPQVPSSSSSLPTKSCLVKSPTTSALSTVATAAPMVAKQTGFSEQQPPAMMAASYRPSLGQPGYSGAPSIAEESVEQSTGELELSPHKKAVFWIQSKGASPVDVTSLPDISQPAGRGSRAESSHADSRVEPETGEVESANISQRSGRPQVGTESSLSQTNVTVPANEATPTVATPQEQLHSDVEQVDEGMLEKVEAKPSEMSSKMSESSDSEGEADKPAKEVGVAIGRCYMDQEKEEGVVSDKEVKERESDQSDQDRHSRSSRRKKRRRSSRSKSHSRSRSRESRKRSSRKSSRRKKYEEEYSDRSDNEDGSKSYHYDDNRSNSDENSEDYRSSSHHRSTRRSSKRYGSSKYDSSSRSSRRSSRKHRRSRSRSRGSHDSRERDYGGKGRDRDRDRSSYSSSSKHKKRDKKEKKKKRHRSSRSGSGDEKNKSQPNVLVGKVGKVGSVRTLGQDKKPSESEDGENQNSAMASSETMAAEQQYSNTQEQSSQYQQTSQQQQHQQYQQMSYYHQQQQQHPSTGQMPYYGTTSTGTYPDYMYSYSQDPYQQQAAWQAWQQQQQAGGGSVSEDGRGQQATSVAAGWGGGDGTAAAATGHAQNQQQQYVAYPIPGGGVAPPPAPTAAQTEAPPTSADTGGTEGHSQEESMQASGERPVAETPSVVGELEHPPPTTMMSSSSASPPPPVFEETEKELSQPSITSAAAVPNRLATTDAPTPPPVQATPPQPPVGVVSTAPVARLSEDVLVAPAYEEGADTPPVTPPARVRTQEQSSQVMETIKEKEVRQSEEEGGGEEIMECDMEIEDDESPEASGKETTPPAPAPAPGKVLSSISTAVPIPIPPSEVSSLGGPKVEQVSVQTSVENDTTTATTGEEENEPLPPGVEQEDNGCGEPLPPGIHGSVTTKDADMSRNLPYNSQSAPSSTVAEAGENQTTSDSSAAVVGSVTMDTIAMATATSGEKTAGDVPTTTTAGSQGNESTATPSAEAVSAAYSAALATSSQTQATSYATAPSGNYFNQPGAAAQYSYAYGQGYGNYAAYSAYLQQAAYSGYPGQYYQGAYGSYGSQYPAASYYGTGTAAYTTAYQQPQVPQATSQPSTTSAPPTSTANKEKPPKIMMEQWNAFQEAATKK